MKKIFTVAVVCIIIATPTSAQTFSEWFKQSETQRKYLVQQIAGLQVYFQFAKQGYDIVRKGLNSIRDIKKGDFNIHNTFFTSLKNVNPAIKKYQKAIDIISIEAATIVQAKKTLKLLKQNNGLTANEITYCESVINFMLQECLKLIDQFLLIITSGNLEMKDDERIRQVDALYADVQDKHAFCSSFANQIKLLILQRQNEQAEIKLSKLINGIK
ncbi:MAG: hypothetical protein J0I09_02665 [Sphingobacteriia bacterium]|nr:hypothetical protein [Sphingobacteriia bacterium]